MIYPPTFLVVALPTALLPYLWALLIWMTLTFAGYLLVLRKIIPRTETLWPALAFPGAFANLMNGQNGLLAFSLLGGALLTLESSPILGGVLFGLLSYKPPMGVLVPIVLAASGRWRAFFAAALTAIALAGISFVMFGAETWRDYDLSVDLTRPAGNGVLAVADLATRHPVRAQGRSFGDGDSTGIAVYYLLRPRSARSTNCMACS